MVNIKPKDRDLHHDDRIFWNASNNTVINPWENDMNNIKMEEHTQTREKRSPNKNKKKQGLKRSNQAKPKHTCFCAHRTKTPLSTPEVSASPEKPWKIGLNGHQDDYQKNWSHRPNEQ